MLTSALVDILLGDDKEIFNFSIWKDITQKVNIGTKISVIENIRNLHQTKIEKWCRWKIFDESSNVEKFHHLSTQTRKSLELKEVWLARKSRRVWLRTAAYIRMQWLVYE